MSMPVHDLIEHSVLPLARCAHCGERAIPGQEFCCKGCATAFQLIHELGFADFYNSPERRVLAVPESGVSLDAFNWYDSENFRQDYAANGLVTFHLPHVMCFSCVWLIERALRDFGFEGRVSLATARLEMACTGRRKLSEVLSLLTRLGYPPTPLRPGAKAQDRSALLDMGASLFLATNIMSFALPEYFAGREGIEPELLNFFRYASLVLCSIALAYPGRSLLRAAWQGIRHRKPTVDLGVVTGLLAAYFFSLFNVLSENHGAVYFDSVSSVIALLLVGRFIQRRYLSRVEEALLGEKLFNISHVAKLIDDQVELVPLAEMKNGDVYRVLPGELIPLSGTIQKGESEVNLANLTGEAEPYPVNLGSKVKAGSSNGYGMLEVKSAEEGAYCYINGACSRAYHLLHKKGALGELSERLATYFFWFAVGLAIVTFWHVSAQSVVTATERTVALLLVACPCVFGFAVPLSIAKAGNLALKKGLVFRSERGITDLARAKHFYFDKTGTLTEGTSEVTRVEWVVSEHDALASLLKKLAEYSAHHVPRAIATWAASQPHSSACPDIIKVEEVFGQGLHIVTGSGIYQLGRFSTKIHYPWANVCLSNEQGEAIAYFALSDHIKKDAKVTIAALEGAGATVTILSGDSKENVEHVAKELSISSVASELSPEAKELLLPKTNHRIFLRDHITVMVGNGFNDSFAMGGASVAVAVFGSSSEAEKMADLALKTPNLSSLLLARAISKSTLSAMKRCFMFAMSYNLAAMILAIYGYISPGIAAILMPINAMIVANLATRWRVKDQA